MPDGWYAVTNQETELGFGYSFPKELFQFVWYWQCFGGGYGYPWYGRTYNIGLEPFTSSPADGLATAIENGTALKLEPGQRINASQKAVVYTNAQGVESINPDGTVILRN